MKVYSPALADNNRAMTETIYDKVGNVLATVNPLGQRTDIVYNVRNRKTHEAGPAVVDAESGQAAPVRPVTVTTYDGVGNVKTVSDPRGNTTTTNYDAANRKVSVVAPLVSVVTPAGAMVPVHPTTTTEYDPTGNVLSVTDANLHRTVNTYDAMNRLLTTTDGAGIQVEYNYDAMGNRTDVFDGKKIGPNGKGQRTAFTYDGLKRNLTTTNALGFTTTFVYNAINKVTRVDADGQMTTYSYDSRNRLTGVDYFNRAEENRIYSYDTTGRMLAVAEPDPVRAGKADVAYEYDALNRVVSETSGGVTHQYAYDLGGNRLTTIYGGSQRVLISSYDALNRLQTVTEKPSLTATTGRVTQYDYDLAGNVRSKVLPNGDTVTTDYDGLNRAVTIVGQAAGNVRLYAYTQRRDAVGNVVEINEEGGASGQAVKTEPRKVSMVYDGAYRLTQETEIVNPGTANARESVTSFTYDAANNRATRTKPGLVGGSVTTLYSYDAGNRLTQWMEDLAGPGQRTVSYSYNGAGSRLSRIDSLTPTVPDEYTYDAEQRLVGLSQGGHSYEYTYDYRTRRAEKKEDNVPTTVIFSGGTSMQEKEGAATTVEYVRGSDWGGGVGGILYTLRGNTPSFTHYDSRGDVTAKTNGAGAVTYQASYEAFGTRTQEQGATTDRQKANTKEEDPSGLLNEGMRYRDLESGTFITADPAGFVDGPNLYAYVRQNPWTKFDPEGLFLETAGALVATGGMSALAYTGIGAVAVVAIAGGVYAGSYIDEHIKQPFNGGVRVPLGSTDCNSGFTNAGRPERGLIMPQETQVDRDAHSRFLATGDRRELDDYLSQRSGGGNPGGKTAKDTVEDNQKKVPNPDGSKGKPDHQAKVDELEAKARAEAGEGETVLRERKIQGQDSNRRPDVQIVDEEGKARKVFEAERRPESSRNQKREAEYERLKLEQETHKVGGEKK